MMTTFLVVVIIAAAVFLVWFALTRKRDVTFNLKLPGANLLLEAKGNSRPSRNPRPQGRNRLDGTG
jgi:hypothetical protein